MDGTVADGLSSAIVNIARLMRHDGIRLVVGTQSPLVLAPELLELVTLAVIHRFHSKDWFSYLKLKLPFEDAAWGQLLNLEPGEALVFASRHLIDKKDTESEDTDTAWNDVDDCTSDGSPSGSLHPSQTPHTSNGHPCPYGKNIFEVKIRSRFTVDLGASIVNRKSTKS